MFNTFLDSTRTGNKDQWGVYPLYVTDAWFVKAVPL